MHRIMVLEASADDTGSVEHGAPAPRITMQPMISERQQDGLFREYDIHNITKVRSAFRLPPILVGKAEDYTRASALASIKTAEDQVFVPERSRMDDLINNHILSTYHPRFWRYKSLGPATTDAEDLSKILTALGTQGALTPNVVIKLANKMLGITIAPIMDDWGDFPFEVIQSYVDQGATIKGLDKFIKQLKKETAPTPPAANSNNPKAPFPIGQRQNAQPVKPIAGARSAATKRRAKAKIQELLSTLE